MDNNVLLPPGELIASNGSRYHVRRWGKGGPTVLLECGLTMMSSCWGWLAPELARTATVLAYDRAGLGWSEAREGLRDAGQLSKELSGLARALPIEGPVVLVGHSMGAMINRAYYRQNPRGISAMIWLDPAHPQGPPANRRMRNLFFFLLEFAHLLAARNLPSITLRILSHVRGLPEHDFKVLAHFLKNPRHLRTCAREARAWKISGEQLGVSGLGDLPLLVLSAQKNAVDQWAGCQQELAGLSSNSRHVTFTEMSHLSMLAHREHVLRVTKEIGGFLAGLAI